MAGEDPAYSAWIRKQRCCLCGAPPPSEQHHKSGAGMALRAHDHDSMPLCRLCHGHELGVMNKYSRREFEERAIAMHLALSKVDPVAIAMLKPKASEPEDTF